MRTGLLLRFLCSGQLKMSNNLPRVTFVIPIYNSSTFLPDCFASIKKQTYPKNKIEVICPDGGSKDNGADIARKYGALVIKNPKRLAEPGFMLGAKKACGDVIVYMGADNRLVEKKWIAHMVKPFSDTEIMGAYSWHRNNPHNTWFTKYFNAFTDPINTFVLGDAANIRTFHLAYKTIKKNKDYKVYNFSSNNIPLLAFDQGFTVRKTYKRPAKTEYDDILPVIDMIDKKMDLAYVPGASNYHYTLEKGFPQFSKKMRWIIDNNITGTPKFGFPTRKKNLRTMQKLRLYFWPFYAASIFLPAVHATFGYIRDGREEWKYHMQITFLMLMLVLYEMIRIKLLHGKSLVDRY